MSIAENAKMFDYIRCYVSVLTYHDRKIIAGYLQQSGYKLCRNADGLRINLDKCDDKTIKWIYDFIQVCVKKITIINDTSMCSVKSN